MTNVAISLEAELMEERAMSASLRNRNLILAQGVMDLRRALAEKEAELALLTTQKEEPVDAQEPADGATHDV